MKEQGIETSITRQAENPQEFFRNSKSIQALNEPKPAKTLKLPDVSNAVRIQALALAEASIASERVQQITGIDPKQLVTLRKLARERGYDPFLSMQLKEEYVSDPPNDKRPRGRPKKRKPEDELDPALTNMPNPARAPPGYVQADQLPPGDWNFMTPTPVHGYSLS